MSEIVAIRFAGTRPGEDIVESLLTSDSAKLSRAKAELDRRSLSMQRVTIDCHFRPGVRKGQLVQVLDSVTGVGIRGKVTGISLTAQINDTSVVTNMQLEIERPTEFYL